MLEVNTCMPIETHTHRLTKRQHRATKLDIQRETNTHKHTE